MTYKDALHFGMSWGYFFWHEVPCSFGGVLPDNAETGACAGEEWQDSRFSLCFRPCIIYDIVYYMSSAIFLKNLFLWSGKVMVDCKSNLDTAGLTWTVAIWIAIIRDKASSLLLFCLSLAFEYGALLQHDKDDYV